MNAIGRLVPEPELRTEEELVVELAGKIRRRGDQGAVASMLGVSQSVVSNVLTNGHGINPKLAEAMGYRKVVRFERVE